MLRAGYPVYSILLALCGVACSDRFCAQAAGPTGVPAGQVITWNRSFYVAVDGRASNKGTRESPWDLASALGGGQPQIEPGDAVLLLDGTFTMDPKLKLENNSLPVRLKGLPGRPIHVRPDLDARRVTIDGGLMIKPGAEHVWISDIEIMESQKLSKRKKGEPVTEVIKQGGLHCYGGKDCKYLNLVIHDQAIGISCWADEIDPEIYGCLIYNNGYVGTDRPHGHGIYTQNKTGTKTIACNIISTPYREGQYAIQAYGSSRAHTDNFLIEDNIFDESSVVVGGESPSHDLLVNRNYIYNSAGLYMGYLWSPWNHDCKVHDNVIVNGVLNFHKFQEIDRSGNRVIGGSIRITDPQGKTQRLEGDPVPSEPEYLLLPNRYAPGRANLAILNWNQSPAVEVSFGTFLSAGDRFRLMDPKNFFGRPEFRGRVDAGGKCAVPTSDTFHVFVILKEEL